MNVYETMTASQAPIRLEFGGGCGCQAASAPIPVPIQSGGCGGGCTGGCGGGCQCGSACGTAFQPETHERIRWYAGQLVGPAEMTGQNSWALERMRRHNRLLHGWGVDCGLYVAPVPDDSGWPLPWIVEVSSGYALAPSGDEILVDCVTRLDVRTEQPATTVAADPWCAPVRKRRDPGAVYYLAVRYDETLTRPVRSATCGCGCDDDACDYSRIREGFAFTLLDSLPGSYTSAIGDLEEAVSCTPAVRQTGSRMCPPCPCSPWVVLADLTISSSGAVAVDQLTHRRFLASFGNFGFSCAAISLGCVEVVRIDAGENDQNAALARAFAAGDVTTVDALIRQGAGLLGTLPITSDGPSPADLTALTGVVADIVAHRAAQEAVLWVDDDWSGTGGQGQSVAEAATTSLLDGARFPAGNRTATQTQAFSGTCGARLFIVSTPKPPPPVLGCIEVVGIIQGLELTDEAHLFEAFQAGDIPEMDRLIRQGVGALGRIEFRSDGADVSQFNDSLQRIRQFFTMWAPMPGTVLWIDADYPGRGGEGQSVAEAVTTSLLDAVNIQAGWRAPAQVMDYSGSCGTRLIIRAWPANH